MVQKHDEDWVKRDVKGTPIDVMIKIVIIALMAIWFGLMTRK